MILEFKKKADAQSFQKMLLKIHADMEASEIGKVFKLADADLKKFFVKQQCFSEMEPAERLVPESCELHKYGRNYCLDIEYQFPEDGGQSEYELAKWFEKLIRKLKLKVKSIPPLRIKSNYIKKAIEDLFVVDNVRSRAAMISYLCVGKNGAFPDDRVDQLFAQFDKEIESLEITTTNRTRLIDACEALRSYHTYQNFDEKMSIRYSEIVDRLHDSKDLSDSLPRAERTVSYRMDFKKIDGTLLGDEDIKNMIKVFTDNYGYSTIDFRAFQLGDQGDGYDEIKSFSHLEKILKCYPKEEKIYLKLEDNPVFYINLFSDVVSAIKSFRSDVLINFSHRDFMIDSAGAHFSFRCCDLIEPGAFIVTITRQTTFSDLCNKFEKIALLPSALIVES